MKRMMLLVALLLVVGATALAQVPAGVGSAAFARLGVDARALAMGGAYVAVPAEQPIPFYNPASLATARDVDIAALYAQPFGAGSGVSYQHIGAVMPLQVQTDSVKGLGVGVSWMGVQISGIYIWDEDDPASGTEFTAASSIYMASVGYELIDGFSVGATAKLYQERILKGRGEGVGVDVGFLARATLGGIPVAIGLNSMDVGRTLVKWSGTAGEPDNYVAWVNKVGVSAVFAEINAQVATDFDWAVGRPGREQIFRVGVEWSPVKLLALRGGWRTDLEGQGSAVSGGVGLRLFNAMEFDYAYTGGIGLNATHFVSMHIWF